MSLTPEQITARSYVISQHFEKVNTEYIKLMAKHIKEIGELTDTDKHRLSILARTSHDTEKITKMLAQETGKALQETYELYEECGLSEYEGTEVYFKHNNITQIPFAENMVIMNWLNSVGRSTAQTFVNLANTTVIQKSYKDAIDEAVVAVSAGLDDYKSQLRKIIKNNVNGARVQYASGITRRLDSAARMNILDGVRSVNNGVRYYSGLQFGADGVEVDAHGLCAPDHLDIQGRQFSIKEFEFKNEHLRRKISTCNCQHGISYIILGVTPPTYNEQELQDIANYSNELVDLNGKQVTRYEASQRMRQLETSMRYKKDEIVGLEAGGFDASKEKKQLNLLRAKYREVADSASLKKRYDRVYVPGYKVKQHNKITDNKSVDKNEIFGVDINKKHFENFSKDFVEIIPSWANDIKNSKVPDFEELMNYYSKAKTAQDKELLQFIAPLSSNVQTYQHFSDERKKYQAEIFSVLSKEHKEPLFRGESGSWVEHYGEFIKGKKITFESLSFTSPIKDATPSKHTGVLFEFEAGTKSINFPGQDMLDDDELILGNFIITNVSKTDKGVPLVRLKQV